MCEDIGLIKVPLSWLLHHTKCGVSMHISVEMWRDGRNEGTNERKGKERKGEKVNMRQRAGDDDDDDDETKELVVKKLGGFP